jgi:type VI secretion system activator RovC-like protein
MKTPPLDPDVADVAPTDPTLTVYDQEHLVTYLRLLDAETEGADWCEVARIVLHVEPDREPQRARLAYDSHLARAKWMTAHGYRHLLRGDWTR